MAFSVTFEFEIDQKVKTMFGGVGVVTMTAVDDGGNKCYFVKTADQSQWYKENQLKKENE